MLDTLCVFDASGLSCIRCGYVAPVPNVIRNCVLVNDPLPAPASGPGTELKKILARVGIVATPDCSCTARAAEMDANGCDWVEANISTVVGWLREQATARGLPFLDAAGRALVRVAVRNARRAATLSGGSLGQPAAGS
jgi:hypothetical protein